MEAATNQSLGEIIKNLTQGFYHLARDTVKLAGAEAKLSSKSLGQIVFLVFFIRSFFFLTWLGFCSVIVLYLLSLQYSLLFSMGVVTILNLIIVLFGAYMLLRAKKNLGFPATRRQFAANNHQEYIREQTQIENKTT